MYSLLFGSAIFWAIIHVISRWVRPEERTPLPLSASRQTRLRSSRIPANGFKFGGTRVYLRDVRISLSTTSFNEWHDKIMLRMKYGALRRVTALFYDTGAILGILVACVAPFALAYFVVQVVLVLMGQDHRPANLTTLVKRGGKPPTATYPTASHLQILVPGMTVPLHHLIPMIFALFVCLVIHESGHAIAAALDATPLVSAGIAIHWILPSAFVSLSSSALEKLPPWPRIRIATSGAWHNIVFWALLWLLGAFSLGENLGRALAGPFWESVEGGESKAHWTDYFTENEPGGALRGWCVPQPWLDGEDQSGTCCSGAPTGALSCFLEVNATLTGRSYCLDPVRVMDPTQRPRPPSLIGNDGRCDRQCPDKGFSCLRPRGDQELLKITYSPWGFWKISEEILIWRGPKGEIFDHVEVGSYLSRASFIPLNLPPAIHLFYEYLSVITMSLFLVNLVPAIYLDGSEVLAPAIDLITAGLAPTLSRPDTEIGDIPWSPAAGTVRLGRVATVAKTMTSISSGLLLSLGLLSLAQAGLAG
ncbi:hypothetical protein DL93DRAFT_1543186 [Clavulina sp. PMI_390]|nr:hypothetical protein DL93DRAFT_1543186 [Clavulina sp. PMI_390]